MVLHIACMSYGSLVFVSKRHQHVVMIFQVSSLSIDVKVMLCIMGDVISWMLDFFLSKRQLRYCFLIGYTLIIPNIHMSWVENHSANATKQSMS